MSGYPKRPLRERLLSKTVINWETGCWEWTAYKAKTGYGTTSLEGRMQLAHRVAYELLVGPIPPGLQLDHLCRVRHCINPAHLEPVTQQENILRGESPSAQHARQTKCRQGHPFTEENTGMDRGKRYCITCNRKRSKNYRDTHRETLHINAVARRARKRNVAPGAAL